MPPSNTAFGRFFRYGDLWLVFGVLGTVLLLILPIPAFLLDMLLAVSIAVSMLTLLVILYVKEPSEFSGFPVLLLFLTLFRLALNVASTRLILLDGYAGHVIEAFGSFVVRGNYVVGLVVFLILVLINFIVITKGAGRIAEVAARFTLDALPGKQMSIDAELNAGLIKEDEARARRRHVEQEADFYGAMDGASKFVRGDAVAAVLITVINVLGGFGIGILQKGMTMGEALQRFTLLSIGDGLASQVPALVTSTAAGILITRVSSKNDLGQDLSKQLLMYPRAITVLSGMLFLMALLPGLPTMPFLILAVITGAGVHDQEAWCRSDRCQRSGRRNHFEDCGDHEETRGCVTNGNPDTFWRETGRTAVAGYAGGGTRLQPGRLGGPAQRRRPAGTRDLSAANVRARNGRAHPTCATSG
jgi:flagellar biosynthesis protein FlhA